MAQKVEELEKKTSRRDGLRRRASKSASEYQKNDDAACATANFAFFNG